MSAHDEVPAVIPGQLDIYDQLNQEEGPMSTAQQAGVDRAGERLLRARSKGARHE